MRGDTDSVSQLQEAVESCLPPELQGKIEYSVRADRFVLKSADRFVLTAFNGSLDLNPIAEGDGYCSTRVMRILHLPILLSYLRENRATLVIVVAKNYIQDGKYALERDWRAHAEQHPQSTLFPEILAEIPIISKMSDLVFFSKLLNLFVQTQHEKGLEAALKQVSDKIVKKWAAAANYYFEQFRFNLEDRAGQKTPRFFSQYREWVCMFKYIIEPAIRRSQLEVVYPEIEALTDVSMTDSDQASLVFFAKIRETLMAGELSIATLNELVLANEQLISGGAYQRLVAIYRALGVYALRILSIRDLPEPGRYERYLSDGRRITLAPLRAANVPYLFQSPQGNAPSCVLGALGQRAKFKNLTL